MIDKYAKPAAEKRRARIAEIIAAAPKGFNPETQAFDIPRLTDQERAKIEQLTRDAELYEADHKQYTEGGDAYDKLLEERQAERRRIAELSRRNAAIERQRRAEIQAIDDEIARYYFPMRGQMNAAELRALTKEHRANLKERDQIAQALATPDLLEKVAASNKTTVERVRAELAKQANQEFVETIATDKSGQSWAIRTWTKDGETSITPATTGE